MKYDQPLGYHLNTYICLHISITDKLCVYVYSKSNTITSCLLQSNGNQSIVYKCYAYNEYSMSITSIVCMYISYFMIID